MQEGKLNVQVFRQIDIVIEFRNHATLNFKVLSAVVLRPQ